MFLPYFIALFLGLVNPSSYPTNSNTQASAVNTANGGNIDSGDTEPEPGLDDGPGTGTGTGGGAGQNPPPPPPRP
ncbi:hypothetical protein [Pedobacter sandarakinus]|uniref:hypothetical protein n=1 Tax=Pedobacter sandarakinus TaxID=353156 RepID=UPI0022485C1D|nr:hypothetical protein [Pedobacter sandarakinus]MCX2574063.1 hypothetical protein [Pedobacter sandarakinus]